MSVWDDWGRLTRFLESARLAFDRERELWSSLELARPESVSLSAPTGQGNKYKVSLIQHLDALAAQDVLYAGVLIHSYALCEAAALDALGLNSHSVRGIEDWGTRLLAAVATDWHAVA